MYLTGEDYIICIQVYMYVAGQNNEIQVQMILT